MRENLCVLVVTADCGKFAGEYALVIEVADVVCQHNILQLRDDSCVACKYGIRRAPGTRFCDITLSLETETPSFIVGKAAAAILEGHQPIDLTLDRLMTAMPLPLAWDGQGRACDLRIGLCSQRNGQVHRPSF